jgi:hypothetical protein
MRKPPLTVVPSTAELLAAGDADAMTALIDRAAGDPGAPFEPEIVAALAALFADRRADFERLRARLKQDAPQVRIQEIDKLVDVAARARADAAAAAGVEALNRSQLRDRIAQRAAVEGWYAIAFALLELTECRR